MEQPVPQIDTIGYQLFLVIFSIFVLIISCINLSYYGNIRAQYKEQPNVTQSVGKGWAHAMWGINLALIIITSWIIFYYGIKLVAGNDAWKRLWKKLFGEDDKSTDSFKSALEEKLESESKGLGIFKGKLELVRNKFTEIKNKLVSKFIKEGVSKEDAETAAIAVVDSAIVATVTGSGEGGPMAAGTAVTAAESLAVSSSSVAEVASAGAAAGEEVATLIATTEPSVVAQIIPRPVMPIPTDTVLRRPVMPIPTDTVLRRPVMPIPTDTVLRRPVMPIPTASAAGRGSLGGLADAVKLRLINKNCNQTNLPIDDNDINICKGLIGSNWRNENVYGACVNDSNFIDACKLAGGDPTIIGPPTISRPVPPTETS